MAINGEQWEALSDKAKWDIKVALRGPDSYYGETLKWFTTAVLRGQVKEVFRVGGLVNSDLQLVVLPYGDSDSIVQQFASAGKLAWNYRHFVEHIAMAAGWLNVPRMRIEPKVWHAIMQQPSARVAIEQILKAAKEWSSKKTYDIKIYRLPHLQELERHSKSGSV